MHTVVVQIVQTVFTLLVCPHNTQNINLFHQVSIHENITWLCSKVSPVTI